MEKRVKIMTIGLLLIAGMLLFSSVRAYSCDIDGIAYAPNGRAIGVNVHCCAFIPGDSCGYYLMYDITNGSSLLYHGEANFSLGPNGSTIIIPGIANYLHGRINIMGSVHTRTQQVNINTWLSW